MGHTGNRAFARLNRQILILLIGFKTLKDWAMRAMIAMASIHQHLKCVGHVLQIRDLPLQLVDMFLRKAFDLCTLPRFVTP